VETAHLVSFIEVAAQQTQKPAQALGAARRERHDNRQLRDLPEPGADAASALDGGGRRFRHLRFDLPQRGLQRLFPELRRVGEQLTQLPDLLRAGLVLFRFGRCHCFRTHDCVLLRFTFVRPDGPTAG
jgi:hypothetical protein